MHLEEHLPLYIWHAHCIRHRRATHYPCKWAHLLWKLRVSRLSFKYKCYQCKWAYLLALKAKKLTYIPPHTQCKWAYIVHVLASFESQEAYLPHSKAHACNANEHTCQLWKLRSLRIYHTNPFKNTRMQCKWAHLPALKAKKAHVSPQTFKNAHTTDIGCKRYKQRSMPDYLVPT